MPERPTIAYAPILKRGFIVACVVGPTLTLINQTEAVLGDARLNLVSFALTLMVPFLVSSVSSFLSQRTAVQAMNDALRQHARSLDLAEDAMKKKTEQIEILEEDLRRADSEMNALRENLHHTADELKNALEKISAPQPLPPMPEPAPVAKDEPAHHIEVASAIDLIKQIRSNAENVNATSKERVIFIGDILTRASAVKDQLSALGRQSNETRQTVAEVDGKVDQISDGIFTLCSYISASAQPVWDMRDAVDHVEQQFARVKDSSHRLGALAMQIRLLSLNASVEAARAGPEGAGFKVVANEVRLLAESSANDLTQIGEATDALDIYLRDMSQLIKGTATSLEKNDKTATGCKDLVTDVCDSIRSLGTDIVDFSAETERQLPRVAGLIDDIENIKSNTEAAVVGSAKNINLCSETIAALEPSPTTSQEPAVDQSHTSVAPMVMNA